jgi:ADP-heptose:LPS heptosyltransferase
LKLQTKRKIDKYLGYCLIIFLIPAAIIAGLLLRIKHGIERHPSAILFIKLMGLGSLVSSAEAIAQVRKKYPGAKLILLTDENIAGGIKPFGMFDDYLKIRNGSIFQTVGDAISGLYQCWLIRRLWVVDLEVYSKLTTVYSLLTLATNRFGFFVRPVFFRKFLNTHNIFFNQFTNLHDNYMQMAVSVTGLPAINDLPAVPRSNEISMPYVLINNTCSDLAPVRKMNNHQLTDVCKWVLQHTSYNLAFAGTAADRSANAMIIADLPSQGRIINIAGEFDFNYYYTFLETKCAFAISIDSAPLHIAKKLGVPTISIWGPTNPSFYLKIRDEEKGRNLFCYNNVSCSPCVHHFNQPPCKGNNFCMTEIKTEEVISKVRQLLVELDFSQRKETDTPVFI